MTWKRTFLLFLACCAVLVAGTWIVLRQTGVATSLVRDALASVLAGSFDLDAAEIDLPRGRVTVSRFRLVDPRGGDTPLLTTSDVVVSLNTNPLGTLGEVHRVVIRGLRIDDLRVAGPDAIRLPDLLRGSLAPKPAAGCPEVVIEDAVIGIRFAASSPPLRFENVDLELLPDAVGGSGLVLSGAMTTSIGTRVLVSGQADLTTGAFRVTAKANDLEISRRAVEPFSQAAAGQLEAAGVQGRVPAAQLWFEHDGKGGAPQGGFLAELAGVTFAAAQLPRPVRDLAGRISGRLQDEGSVSLALETATTDAAALERIGLTGAVRRLFGSTPEGELRVDIARMRIDEPLLGAARAHAIGSDVLDAVGIEPRGELDARVDLRIRAGLEVELDATVRGGAATYRGFGNSAGTRVGFPHRVTDVAGTARMRGQRVFVGPLTARDAAGAALEFQGEFPLTASGPAGSLSARAEGLVLGPDLRVALGGLGPDVTMHYDEYAPTGVVDVDVKIAALTPSGIGDILVRVAPREAEATWRHLPCRVRKITGQMEIDAHGVAIDLTGERSGRPLLVRGRFQQHDGPGQDAHRHELRVRSEGLSVDEDLRVGLTTLVPRLQTLWETLEPGGEVAGELAFWQPFQAAQPSYDVRIDLRDAIARPRVLPVSVRGLTGTVFVHGDGTESRTELHLVRGSVEQPAGAAPAQILLSGSVATSSAATDVDLSSVVMGLQLDAQLADVLDRTGAFPRASWDVFAPAGSIDVIARHQHRVGEGSPRQHLRVQLREVSSNAAMLPAAATKLVGEVTVVDGVTTLSDVRGFVGTSPIVVRDARILHEGAATRVRAKVAADDFPVNDDLARLFGDSPLRETFLRRKPRGRMKVTELELDFAVPDRATGAGDFDLRFSGQILARNCGFLLAVPIEDVNGVLTLRDCTVDGESGRINGSLTGMAMSVLGRQLTDIDASFVATPAEFSFGDVALRLHGGRVTGIEGVPHLRYATAGEGTLSANLQWQGVRLSEALGESGRAGMRGSVNGELRLTSLPGTRLLDTRGQGRLQVSAGKLGEVPLFRGIYALLQRHPQFTGASLEFVLGDRRIDIQKLELNSQVVDVRGKGSLAMDGYLDMTLELPSLFGDGADFLILPQLLHNAFSKVVEFKVHGYLRSPVVTPVVLFQGAPARRPIEPIPAVIPELPRRRH